MTPREKVAAVVLDAAAEYLVQQYGASHGLDHEVDRTRIMSAIPNDAILNALASGSGDHAELEVVGWMIEDLILPQQTFTTDDDYARHRAAYRYEGEVTATVEPLVTAASAEARMTELRSAYCAAESDAMTLRKRATQAERQRDELRKALEPFAEAAESLDDETGDHDHIWELPAAMSIDAGHLRTARALLANQGADQ
ncbi:hypothetical protein [Brevundimonas pondensis]|uniref:Uncharacterized protein n=1 Tax=Brevundimonas pondensis TaxID=2774189 RepID=A0ABX7SMF0_9CAUL|nr:hypothetical protein [Brevundimonas pondensis]QTC88060.1 hypothetical protein IFE19_01240 [Brevundimonas pondensis]